MGKNHDAYGEISELPGGKGEIQVGAVTFSNVYGILGKTEKAEELIERFRKRTTYTIDTRVCREKLLVAGSLQDRKESENDTFCGSRSGSRRSDHGPWTALSGAG